MDSVQQNTLYLTTPGSYVSREHLTLQVEVPVYADDLPTEERVRKNAIETRKLSIPVHRLESICLFGQCSVSPPALELCWENGVAVHYLSEWGRLHARLSGVPDTSVTLRRAQFRAADEPARCLSIARQIIAGKIQNARNSLLRAARECDDVKERGILDQAAESLGAQVRTLPAMTDIESLRGAEGLASVRYFDVFTLTLKHQRNFFEFKSRSRRPPRDRVNCLLSFLYALVRHDCVAALTAAGLDPFVGFLHVDRPNRPSLALDLMEEYRPWLADRLAITLINRQQVGETDFRTREGGAVEFTDAGRKRVIQAYQHRKQETVRHPLLDQNFRIAQLPFVQARVLARHLRGDLGDYIPHVPK